MPALLDRMTDGSSLVAIGNIHGQGEELLEYLAELPADESDGAQSAPSPAAAPAQARRPAWTRTPRTPRPTRSATRPPGPRRSR